MVGKSVLLACLDSELVESVLIINRKSVGIDHPKMKEIIHADFLNLTAIKEELKGYDACFFCMGVYSVGMNEETYTKLTFDITNHFVNTLFEINPEMVFNYVSGIGSDSSEQSRTMWARVKGKTENIVLNKGFKDAYAFRLGMLVPEKGVKMSLVYKIFKPLFPLFRLFNSVTTSSKIGKAMIHSVLLPQQLKHLKNSDMNELAAKVI